MSNFNDSEIDPNNIDENTAETSAGRMNTKKRKRVVNLLVRSVGTPIQHSYVVSEIVLCYFYNSYFFICFPIR